MDMTGRAVEASRRGGIFARPGAGGVEGGGQYTVARALRGATIADALRRQTDVTVGLAANSRGLDWPIEGKDGGEFRKRKGLERARAGYYLVEPVPAAATSEAIRRALAE